MTIPGTVTRVVVGVRLINVCVYGGDGGACEVVISGWVNRVSTTSGGRGKIIRRGDVIRTTAGTVSGEWEIFFHISGGQGLGWLGRQGINTVVVLPL